VRPEVRRKRALSLMLAATFAITAVPVSAGTAMADAPSSAHTLPTPSNNITVDAATCGEWLQGLKLGLADPQYRPQVAALISGKTLATLTDKDCRVEVSMGSTTKAATTMKLNSNQVQPMLVFGITHGYWTYANFMLGPVTIATWHVNVGIKWTSFAQYKVMWGPDCYLTTLPLYYGGYDGGGWCGVYWDGWPVAVQPGSNFYIAPLMVPFYKRWFWMRFWAYADGTSSTPWGGNS
jgi:hypothetical protein